MDNRACVAFLKWCLPRLECRWPGYRKVRRLVGKRLDRRLAELGLADLFAYRAFLVNTPAEWAHLDAICRPKDWVERAFVRRGRLFCLAQDFRRVVELVRQDIRQAMPDVPFDLILCRNLAFTYFDGALQRRMSAELRDRLQPGGFLVLGSHEALPASVGGFVPVVPKLAIYRREASRGLPHADRSAAVAGSTQINARILEASQMRSEGEILDLDALRKRAAWYREFAERAGAPGIWERRLRTALRRA
jgi:hypothetical protein